jgi:hypothetical protein
MKIHSISVDEQNRSYSVTLISGEAFNGYESFDQITIVKNKEGKLEPVLDQWARKFLRERAKQKQTNSKKKRY